LSVEVALRKAFGFTGARLKRVRGIVNLAGYLLATKEQLRASYLSTETSEYWFHGRADQTINIRMLVTLLNVYFIN
jgi:hypothetical protein